MFSIRLGGIGFMARVREISPHTVASLSAMV